MGVLAPVSVTKGPNGQDIETYQQWNIEAWWDEGRWTLTGTQADSNYKAGLWRQDAEDFFNIVAPPMRTAAATWGTQYQTVDQAKGQVTAAKGQLVGFTGKDADALNTQADNFIRSLDQRAEATDPIKPALLSAADIIDQNFPIVQRWWNQWEQDLANAPKCKFDTEQMMAPMQNMARAVLQAAKAIMQGYQTELETPEVTQPPPSQLPGGTTAVTAADQQAAANPSDPAANPAASVPGVVTAGTPHAAVTNPGSGTAALPGTTVGNAPGTVVTPSSNPSGGSAVLPAASTGTAAPAGPTLAGIGAGTVAPSVPTAPAFAPSPVTSTGGGAAPMPMLPTGLAGPGRGPTSGGTTSAPAFGSGAGLAPFMPTTGGGAGQVNKRDEQDDRKRQVVVSPVTGAPIGGARGARSGAIRPGTAKPINPGVAAGLLGRAAKDADGLDIPTSTLRKASRKARRDKTDDAEDMFLDEDAWLIDDPGAGVVEAHQPQDPGAASAVIG